MESSQPSLYSETPSTPIVRPQIALIDSSVISSYQIPKNCEDVSPSPAPTTCHPRTVRRPQIAVLDPSIVSSQQSQSTSLQCPSVSPNYSYVDDTHTGILNSSPLTTISQPSHNTSDLLSLRERIHIADPDLPIPTRPLVQLISTSSPDVGFQQSPIPTPALQLPVEPSPEHLPEPENFWSEPTPPPSINCAEALPFFCTSTFNQAEKLLSFLQFEDSSQYVRSKTSSVKQCTFNKTTLQDIRGFSNFPRMFFKDNNPSRAKPVIPETGHPFIMIGSKTFRCIHGPDYNKLYKERYRKAKEEQAILEKEILSNMDDTPVLPLHPPPPNPSHFIPRSKKKKGVSPDLQQSSETADIQSQALPTAKKPRKPKIDLQPSNKAGCPAYASIRHVIVFTEVYFPKRGEARTQAKKDLVKNILSGKEVAHEHRFYTYVPRNNDHSGHLVGPLSGYSHFCSKPIRDRIKQMTVNGKLSFDQIVELIPIQVQNEMFQDLPPPLHSDRAFYPKRSTVYNIYYGADTIVKTTAKDVENLEQDLAKWKSQCPEGRRYFVQLNEREILDPTSPKMVVLQTEHQRYLLNKYGNKMVMMDGTYKSSRYQFPLYFLSVPTNCRYMVVATIFTSSETASSLAKGLAKIKEWNPRWEPEHVMTDCQLAELNAFLHLFPNAKRHICKFHYKRAWYNWLRQPPNLLPEDVRDTLYKLMCSVSDASTEHKMLLSLDKLRSSPHYTEQISTYFDGFWVDTIGVKLWCSCYDVDFEKRIETNNGLERLNRLLKETHLHGKTSKSNMVHLVRVLLLNMFDFLVREYVEANVTALHQHKPYHPDVPLFLRDRPKFFARHVFDRWQSAKEMLREGKAVQQTTAPGLFTVDSQSVPGRLYTVCLGDDEELPWCQCDDWEKTRLPCKHFCLVFLSKQHPRDYSWADMSPRYSRSVFFNLDLVMTTSPELSIYKPPFTELDTVNRVTSPESSPSLSSSTHPDHCIKQLQLLKEMVEGKGESNLVTLLARQLDRLVDCHVEKRNPSPIMSEDSGQNSAPKQVPLQQNAEKSSCKPPSSKKEERTPSWIAVKRHAALSTLLGGTNRAHRLLDNICIDIIRPPSPLPRTASAPLVGLRNFGNSCFLNAVLQVLRATDELRLSLNGLHVPSCGPRCCICVVHKFLTNRASQPQEILPVLNSVWPEYLAHPKTQQDAHEFLMKLGQQLDNCDPVHYPFSETFLLATRSRVHMPVCGHYTSWKGDLTTALRVDVGQETVHDAFQSAFANEDIQNVSCSSCNSQRDGVLMREVISLPKCLILHIFRYRPDNTKDTGTLSFSNELHVLVGDIPSAYQLYGVVQHKGISIHSGHYTSLVLRNERWYSCNDENVSPTTSLYQEQSSAYLLFYRLKDDNGAEGPLDEEEHTSVNGAMAEDVVMEEYATPCQVPNSADSNYQVLQTTAESSTTAIPTSTHTSLQQAGRVPHDGVSKSISVSHKANAQEVSQQPITSPVRDTTVENEISSSSTSTKSCDGDSVGNQSNPSTYQNDAVSQSASSSLECTTASSLQDLGDNAGPSLTSNTRNLKTTSGETAPIHHNTLESNSSSRHGTNNLRISSVLNVVHRLPSCPSSTCGNLMNNRELPAASNILSPLSDCTSVSRSGGVKGRPDPANCIVPNAVTPASNTSGTIRHTSERKTPTDPNMSLPQHNISSQHGGELGSQSTVSQMLNSSPGGRYDSQSDIKSPRDETRRLKQAADVHLPTPLPPFSYKPNKIPFTSAKVLMPKVVLTLLDRRDPIGVITVAYVEKKVYDIVSFLYYVMKQKITMSASHEWYFHNQFLGDPLKETYDEYTRLCKNEVYITANAITYLVHIVRTFFYENPGKRIVNGQSGPRPYTVKRFEGTQVLHSVLGDEHHPHNHRVYSNVLLLEAVAYLLIDKRGIPYPKAVRTCLYLMGLKLQNGKNRKPQYRTHHPT